MLGGDTDCADLDTVGCMLFEKGLSPKDREDLLKLLVQHGFLSETDGEYNLPPSLANHGVVNIAIVVEHYIIASLDFESEPVFNGGEVKGAHRELRTTFANEQGEPLLSFMVDGLDQQDCESIKFCRPIGELTAVFTEGINCYRASLTCKLAEELRRMICALRCVSL
jgi:hypothetical protein